MGRHRRRREPDKRQELHELRPDLRPRPPALGRCWIIFSSQRQSRAPPSARDKNANTRGFSSTWVGWKALRGGHPRQGHPKYRTPWNAIWFHRVTIAIGVGLGSWLGPVRRRVIGIMQTLGLIIVYSMGNICRMIFTDGRGAEFNIWPPRHIPVSPRSARVGFWKNVETRIRFNPKERIRLQPADVSS